jgi:hypothetical protein
MDLKRGELTGMEVDVPPGMSLEQLLKAQVEVYFGCGSCNRPHTGWVPVTGGTIRVLCRCGAKLALEMQPTMIRGEHYS